MLKNRRHEQILDLVSKEGFLTVEQACTLLDASPATVRRDFGELADRAIVRRIRGGIELSQKSPQGMKPFALRQVERSAEKAALARHAAGLLKPGDTIFIDGGTTTAHLAFHLPDMPLRVITNSLRLAALLDEHHTHKQELEIYLTGGYLFPNSGLLLGPHTQSSLEQYRARWAFLSAGGVTSEGIFNTTELVVDTERAMIRNADTAVILADHTKMDRHAMCYVGPLRDIDILITDRAGANTQALESARELGVEVRIA